MRRSLLGLLFLFAAGTASAQTLTTQIKASRTSCKAPCAVFFDAIEDRDDAQYPLTQHSDASVKEFHDLLYVWDFADPTAGNWTEGAAVGTPAANKNTARGPLSAHVFKTAGTFVVRVTVTDVNGLSATDTETITVTDFTSGETSCISTSGTFTGCTGTNVTSSATASSIIATELAAGRRRVLFRGGETWALGSNVALSGSASHWGSYGTGKANFTTSGTIPMTPGTDSRYTNLHFTGGSSRTANMSATGSDMMLMGISTGSGTMGGIFQANDNFGTQGGYFIVECEIPESIGATATSYLEGRRVAYLGNRFHGTSSEHIIRNPHIDGGVFSHNSIADQESLKLVWALRGAPLSGTCNPCGEAVQNVVFSWNEIGNTFAWAVAMVQAGSSAPADAIPPGRDILIENNYCYKWPGQTGNAKKCFQLFHADGITVRNNIFNLTGFSGTSSPIGIGLAATPSAPTNVHQYNNTCYSNSSGQDVTCSDWPSGSAASGISKNNLLFAPNATRTMHGGSVPATQSNNVTVASGGPSPFTISLPDEPLEFQLDAAGTADDAGTSVPVKEDLRLTARPKNGLWDAGAFELDPGGPASDDCHDGIDQGGNDRDTLVDAADPCCAFGIFETCSQLPCDNGLDDDGWGDIDIDDPGCAGSPSNGDEFDVTTECDDDLDNDNNGLKDALDPLRCVNPLDDFESRDSVSIRGTVGGATP